MFPRSSNKPMQAAAMRACGLALDGELLALASASHSGEDFHVTGVRKILAGAGLTEDALQCPPALPLDEAALWRFLARGRQAGPGAHELLGQARGHARHLRRRPAGRARPTATPDHPLQREIKAALGRLAGEAVAATGVDGCGAPLFALSLTGLARAFRALVLAAPGFSRTIGRRCRPCQSRMDVGDEPLGTRAPPGGSRAAAQVRGRGRAGVRPGRRPGRCGEDGGRLAPGGPGHHGGVAAHPRRGSGRRRGPRCPGPDRRPPRARRRPAGRQIRQSSYRPTLPTAIVRLAATRHTGRQAGRP